MRVSLLRDRRGIALPLVLFVIVVLGAITAGSFYVARLEQRTGDNTLASVRALNAAEAGIANAVANWNGVAWNTTPVGTSVALGTVSLGGTSYYADTLTRINDNIFMVQSVGLDSLAPGRVRARRRLGVISRLDFPLINMRSAITVRNGIDISGSSEISGRDSVPAGWGAYCDPPGPMQPGIRDSSGNVTTSGSCSGASCIAGSPQIMVDTTINTSSFTQFGSTSFSQLAAEADKTVSGTLTGVGPTFNAGPPVTCRTSDLLNWGDPINNTSACFSYFPVIYAPGNLNISGGIGQGILLVQGDLTVQGGFQFYGPVIVLGTVSSTGTGGHFFGGLMASNASLDVTLFSGNSVVDYSACAITRALNGVGKVRPLAEHSWAQLYE